MTLNQIFPVNNNFQINSENCCFHFKNCKKISYYAFCIFQTIASPLYALFDSGFAHLVGLDVLKHGTCLPNHVSILLNGGMPRKGGSQTGSTNGLGLIFSRDRREDVSNEERKACQNHFYVFKDETSMVQEGSAIYERYGYLLTCLYYKVAFNLSATCHSVLSGIGYMLSDLPTKKEISISKIFLGTLVGLASPIIRFKFDPHEASQIFENDPGYEGTAYRTSKHISSDRVGIYGTLKYGLNREIFSRMYAHKSRVLLGIAELTTAVALTALIFPVGSTTIIASRAFFQC